MRIKITNEGRGWVAALGLGGLLWAVILAICVAALRMFVGTHTSWWWVWIPLFFACAMAFVLAFTEGKNGY